MAVSNYYTKMVADLGVARRITYQVPLNVCNTEIQELKVKSYIFMSHAVIEEYLESIALDVATRALAEYVNTSKICRALVGLISSGLIARVDEGGISKKIKREPFEDIGIFANTAFGRFKSVVGSNNGIKKDDQLKLLIPIGIDPETEDPVTMAALDSFGGKRGAIAHAFKIAKSHTLSEIDGDIATIRTGLVNYDEACVKCLN